jgi:uncharacterized phage protein gp47/JayE
MAYTRKTLSQIIASIKADLFSRFPTVDPTLENSFAGNVAEVQAGGVNGLYGYIDWTAKQPFPDTCQDEFIDRWASILNLQRLAATKASGNATFTGSIGGQVNTGAVIISSSGVQYEVIEGFTLAATSELHAIQAVEAGLAGNAGAGAVLTFVSVPSGIGTTATVDGSGLTGGRDLETDDELRVRLLARFRSPPKGGKALDYVAWASEATTATRAWVFTYDEPGLETVAVGEVLLYFAMDNKDSSDGADIVTNGAFAADTDWTKGTGWTIAAGKATHAAGTGSDLSQAIASLVAGRTYVIEFTLSGRTAGTIIPKVGSGGTGPTISANGSYVIAIACKTNTTLYFTASATFDGSIDDVSLIYSGIGNAGIPDSGDVTDVQDYVDGVRPLGASFTAAAPKAYPINFEVSITPDTPTNRTAVELELYEMIKTKGEISGSIKLYDIFEAMSIVPDLTDWDIVSPAATVTAGQGELPMLGVVTYS